MGVAADLKAQHLISEWIAQQTELHPKGNGRFVGLCPMHDDHRPSLQVNDHGSRKGTGTFRCFVCNRGGDLFDWLVWTKGLSVSEAIELVADATPGWTKRKNDPVEVKQRQERDEAAEVMEAAVAWLKSQLRQEHIELLARRNGLTPATIKLAEIGYGAPGFREAMNAVGYSDDVLYNVALLDKARETGRLYFPFERTLTIPMRDQGRIVYMTGRKLEDKPAQQKYRHQTVTRSGNEPHSPYIFRPLYWLDSLRKPDIERLYIVEGPMDALAIEQRQELLGGNVAVVAHLSNTLSPEQAQVLAPLAQGVAVTVIADGDDRGIRGGDDLRGGALMSAEQLSKVGISARVMICKAGEDPASMGDDLANLKESLDPVDVWCRHVLPGLADQQKTKVLKDRLIPLLASYPVIDRDAGIGQVASALGQNTATLKGAIAEFLKETPAQREQRWPLTDLGNAQRMVHLFGNNIRYCYPQNKWYTWAGNRWEQDRTGQIERYGKATIQAMRQEAAKLSGKAALDLTKFCNVTERQTRRIAMIQAAQSEEGIPVLPTDFDADRWLLNTESGIMDLRNLTFAESTREAMLSKLAPVRYEVAAQCPRWLSFMDEVTDGNTELQQYLQRASGYSLTGDTRERCFFLLYGTGSNGKSVFLSVLRRLLGDYAQTAAFETFLSRKGDAGIRNDLASLFGIRFVVASEAGAGRMLDEGMVKVITGHTDEIRCRFLHQEEFSYRPQFKLWLATNHLPKISGTDRGIWSRVRMIPFTVTIPAERQDRELEDKLSQELPGILNWALEGLVLWQKDGLGDCAAITEATEEYREDSDVLAEFLGDETVTDSQAMIPARDLYERYLSWCEAAHERFPMQYRNFNSSLTSRGVETTRSGNGSKYWRGLRLQEAGQQTMDYPQDKRND